jgi:hypothetical protein
VPRIDAIPFESERKFMATLNRSADVRDDLDGVPIRQIGFANNGSDTNDSDVNRVCSWHRAAVSERRPNVCFSQMSGRGASGALDYRPVAMRIGESRCRAASIN